jgi:hypothetical protein
MKKNTYILFILSLLSIVFIASCNFSESKKTLTKTKVKFEDSNRHYFAIPQDKQQDVIFRYYNTGEHPLAILEVQSSCGCAKVEFPDRLIEPEGEGDIVVHYDSYKNVGYSQVFITVVMNTEPVSMHTLVFDLNIVPDEGFSTDYEKTFEKHKEADEAGGVKELVEGDASEQGYYTDSSAAELNY